MQAMLVTQRPRARMSIQTHPLAKALCTHYRVNHRANGPSPVPPAREPHAGKSPHLARARFRRTFCSRSLMSPFCRSRKSCEAHGFFWPLGSSAAGGGGGGGGGALHAALLEGTADGCRGVSAAGADSTRTAGGAGGCSSGCGAGHGSAAATGHRRRLLHVPARSQEPASGPSVVTSCRTPRARSTAASTPAAASP